MNYVNQCQSISVGQCESLHSHILANHCHPTDLVQLLMRARNARLAKVLQEFLQV